MSSQLSFLSSQLSFLVITSLCADNPLCNSAIITIILSYKGKTFLEKNNYFPLFSVSLRTILTYPTS